MYQSLPHDAVSQQLLQQHAAVLAHHQQQLHQQQSQVWLGYHYSGVTDPDPFNLRLMERSVSMRRIRIRPYQNQPKIRKITYYNLIIFFTVNA